YVMDGFTRNAVIGKAHRLGLPKRSPATSSRVTQRRVRHKPSLASVGSEPAPRTASITNLADVRYRTQVERELERSIFESENSSAASGDRITLMTLTSRTCKWPIGDPGDEDFHFCSRNAELGGSYCAFHHRLAYQGVRRRRTEEGELIAAAS